MTVDLLANVAWRCCSTPPGAVAHPSALAADAAQWIAAVVPGTAAVAVSDHIGTEAALAVDYDAADWWFCCDFDSVSGGPWVLELADLATVADVWLNGSLLLQSSNMFRRHRLDIEQLQASNHLAIRCAALTPLLGQRRPRPRWRTALVSNQNLRWWRTSLIGRMPSSVDVPAIVGPAGGVRLRARSPVEVLQRRVSTRIEGGEGVVEVAVSLQVADDVDPTTVEVHVDDVVSKATLPSDCESNSGWITLRACVRVADVKLWWPHTHGPQPLYRLSVRIDDYSVGLGHIGFRTVEVDRSGDGFVIVVNGVPVFCRGACWTPFDVDDTGAMADTLLQMRDAGMNMVRVTGTTRYEGEVFWRLCDELGILVWQDAMLATLDPPDDEEFLSELTAELADQFALMQGRPSLVIVSGGSETEQQAAFFGLPAERREIAAIARTIPDAVRTLLPGVAYVTSSPTGGPLPTHVGAGVAHYFGVGAYRRPLSDARLSGVRFAAECLAFATPPDRATVAEAFGSARLAGHHPRWKNAVPRDNGTSWDFEDVRDFYVREVFGIDVATVRFDEPEFALDLGRSAVGHAIGEVFSEWRRPGSLCAGGLVLCLRDAVAGAGWGLIDSYGRPKAPWYVLRRISAPIALLCTDEGLNGLAVHILNDCAEPLVGELYLTAFTAGGAKALEAQTGVTVPSRSGISLSVDALVGAFRDLNYAYRFGSPAVDCVRFGLVDEAGAEVVELVHLPLGQRRSMQHEIGLAATVRAESEGVASLSIKTRDLAQWVNIDVPGWRPQDSWFHLEPGGARQIRLTAEASGTRPEAGYVRALNAKVETAVRVGD